MDKISVLVQNTYHINTEIKYFLRVNRLPYPTNRGILTFSLDNRFTCRLVKEVRACTPNVMCYTKSVGTVILNLSHFTVWR